MERRKRREKIEKKEEDKEGEEGSDYIYYQMHSDLSCLIRCIP